MLHTVFTRRFHSRYVDTNLYIPVLNYFACVLKNAENCSNNLSGELHLNLNLQRLHLSLILKRYIENNKTIKTEKLP